MADVHDLARSLRGYRREVVATASDYMRLWSWDEELATSVLQRMMHHTRAHSMKAERWAFLFHQLSASSSNSYPAQPSCQGLASQAAEVARRLLLRLQPSRPQLFTPTVYTLLLKVLYLLIILLASDASKEGGSQLQQQYLTASQQQYEDTIECVLLALEQSQGQAQPQQKPQQQPPQQHQQQQTTLRATNPAMQLLGVLCNLEHGPLLRVLCGARFAARAWPLAVCGLFDPCSVSLSSFAYIIFLTLLRWPAVLEEEPWVCNPNLATNDIELALGHAEACMVWHVAYSTSAIVQAVRVPVIIQDIEKCPYKLLKTMGIQALGCAFLIEALQHAPPAKAADLLIRRPGLLRALCALCDSAACDFAAFGTCAPQTGGLWLDEIGEQVTSSLSICIRVIGTCPHQSPAHVRAMMLGLSSLLRLCERAPRLKATTSTVLLTFKAWRSILPLCLFDVSASSWMWCGVALDKRRARAALAVLGRTHALGRLLEAAGRTDQWLEGRPGGIADVTTKEEPCRVMDALISTALLSAYSAVIAGEVPIGIGIGISARQQQQWQHQRVADVHRICQALLDAGASSIVSDGNSTALAAAPRVPAQLPRLVRDLQRAIAALAPHGNPNFHGS